MALPPGQAKLRLRPIVRVEESPAIDDYVGRYAQCYEDLAAFQADLLEELRTGKITGEEFDELWNDVEQEFLACRERVDEDHDIFEEENTLDKSVGMQF